MKRFLSISFRFRFLARGIGSGVPSVLKESFSLLAATNGKEMWKDFGGTLLSYTSMML